jgi:hypothetical protein
MLDIAAGYEPLGDLVERHARVMANLRGPSPETEKQ